jgi:hypothetical protein
MSIAIYCPSILLAFAFLKALLIFHNISFDAILTTFPDIRFMTAACPSLLITFLLTMRIAEARRHAKLLRWSASQLIRQHKSIAMSWLEY